MEDVDDFHWRPHQATLPKDAARASLKDGGEWCSCFPNRSLLISIYAFTVE